MLNEDWKEGWTEGWNESWEACQFISVLIAMNNLSISADEAMRILEIPETKHDTYRKLLEQNT